MRIATGSIPERAVQKVLLINRFEQHHNGPLRHLVFKGRYPKRTLTSIRLRYVVTPDRRCSITTRFESVNQPEEVLPQIHGILFPRLTINSHRAVFARALVRVLHPFHIEIVIQRGERHRAGFPRKCGYPLLFR
jgi:hypothetical protein